MPRKVTIKNLTALQRERMSVMSELFAEVDFGNAIYDALVGTDVVTLKADQITAQFGDTGLSLIVGNTTVSITNDGLTTFFNVGGTNSIGSDGVDTFLIDGGVVTLYGGG